MAMYARPSSSTPFWSRRGEAGGPSCSSAHASQRLADVFSVDLSVDLRSGDVGVAEELLDHADVHAAAQHVRREAVTQRVRRHSPEDARLVRITLEYQPETLAGQALAAAVHEQRRLITLPHQPWASESQVVRYFLRRLVR
jgi:hypothetical protein